MNATMYRQGDVLIRRIDKLPGGERVEVAPVNGRVVLAEGEATGHAHAVRAVGVALCMYGIQRILEVQRESVLEHEEHADIVLPPGNYEVVRQREYTPEAIRQVAD